MNKINISRNEIIKLAIKMVKHKFYGDKEVNNFIKSQPLYQARLEKAIYDVIELIRLNNNAIATA